MEIRRKVINGNRWELVNEYWENSRAWGHKTTIIRNGYDYDSHKVRYYNRTWEAYTYQSCMYGAVGEIRAEEMEKFIRRYKEENNITRFKKGQREACIKEFEKDGIGFELRELSNAIRERSFD